MAAQRPARSAKPAIRLTPNKGPIFHPSTLQEEPQTPLPPTDHAHPNPSPTRNDTYIAAARLPDGESSNSDSDDNEPKPIPAYEKSNSWFEESKWAAQDPTRVLSASELPSSFTWNTVDTLNKKEGQALKDFKDAMYRALDKVYKLQNGSRLRIKIPHDIVDNISYSFAHAQMLNPDLAARTESFYVDWPNQLLTVAVPTDFPLKKPWTSQGNCKYAFYHKTDWATVPKILSEQLVRPADWTRDSEGVPQQFPSYGPFGMVCEVHSVHAPLNHHAACQLSNRIYKIGKGQLTSGILGFFQCPEMTKHLAGGNDQVQRGAKLTGGSKNDHAAVPRSEILSVAYVATTQNLPDHLITWEYKAQPEKPHPDPPPQPDDAPTSKPSRRSRHSTSDTAYGKYSAEWKTSKSSHRRPGREPW